MVAGPAGAPLDLPGISGPFATPYQPPALRARGLDVFFGPVQVCFGIDLDLPEGSIGALVGTNGAGKSTMLRAVAGALPLRGGTVELFGDDITSLPPEARARRGLLLAAGGRGTFPSLTVEEGFRVATWPFRHDRRRVEAALGRAGTLFPSLAKRRRQRAGTLSGGEQQLANLARAIIAGPRLLMVDELTLGLSPAAADEVVAAVADLVANGSTVLLVEQSISRALAIADRAWFLDRGEVRFAGPAAALADRTDLLAPARPGPP